MRTYYYRFFKVVAVAFSLHTGSAFAQVTNPSPCDLSLGIPDAGCATDSDLIVPITVTGVLGELGTSAMLDELEIIIWHNSRNDLQLWLTPPEGTEHALMLNRGESGPHYGDPTNCPEGVLLFEDSGDPLSTMTGGTGIFAAEEPFSTYTGDPNGTWHLRICDNSGVDQGSLEYISLSFISQPVGIDQIDDVSSLSIWPNPAEENVSVELHTSIPVRLKYQVLDALGRRSLMDEAVLGRGMQEFDLDLSMLPAGVYTIQFQINESVVVRNVIKN